MIKDRQEASIADEPKKTRKEIFLAGVTSRHPELDMEDEEAVYAAIDDEYNEREERLRRNDEDNERLNSMFTENPSAAYFVNDMMSGENNVAEALLRHFGDTFRDALDDPSPENVEAFAKAMDDYTERLKESERLQSEYEQNVEETQATISEWAEENGVDETRLDEIREYINEQLSNLVIGKITPEMLDFAWRGINYEKDVVSAEENGIVKGRNQRIDETMRKGKGDGMPAIIGGAKADTAPRDQFLQNAGKKDPWDDARRERY